MQYTPWFLLLVFSSTLQTVQYILDVLRHPGHYYFDLSTEFATSLPYLLHYN